MSEQNPYSTPEASLDTEQDQYYQPKIFSFSGRIGRLRYLAYSAGANLLLMLVLMPVMGGTMSGTEPADQSVLGLIAMTVFYIATITFSIMYGKRRLNDLDKSGWWFLLFLIPIVNIIMTIYLIFFAGSKGLNNFGAVPVENTLGVKILALFLPLLFILGILAAIAIPAYQDYVMRAQEIQMQQ